MNQQFGIFDTRFSGVGIIVACIPVAVVHPDLQITIGHHMKVSPRSMNPRIASLTLAGVFGVLAATASQATPIPFNEALTFSVNPNATGLGGQSPCCDYINVITNTSTAATASYSQSGSWGSVLASASADLSTGQLKMQASAANNGQGPFPYTQANAIFGDSFTTTSANGSPFAWNASTATFNMALDGTLTSSDAFAGSEGGFAILSILQKGTLDPNKPLIGGSNSLQYFLWDFGNTTQQIFYTDQNGNSQPLAITAGYTSLPSTLSATFAPNGDFDWVLLLGASGQPSVGQSFDVDLSHTVTLSYVGPEGGITTADSGLFTNITQPATAVPEPGTLSLFLFGIAGLRFVRRKVS
jgi:PEP-CTERM motif